MFAVGHFALTASGLTTFGAIIWAVRNHFVSAAIPRAMIGVSALSASAFLTYLHQLWSLQQPWWFSVLGVGFHAASLALFVWTVRVSRTRRLRLAFEKTESSFLLTDGPYRFVRHPFYLSYLIFWAGCAIGAGSVTCGIFFLIISGTYAATAWTEERGFLAGPLAAPYAQYIRGAGFLWPKRIIGS